MAHDTKEPGGDKPETVGGEVVTFPHGEVLPPSDASPAKPRGFRPGARRNGVIPGQSRYHDPDPSLPLQNPKWERFAQMVAGGGRPADAYEAIGNKRHEANATRLRETRAVKSRIVWLQSDMAERVVKEAVKGAVGVAYGRVEALADCDRAIALATSEGQAGAFVAAVQLKAKIVGLLVERKEVGQPGDFDAMDRDALKAYVERESRRLIGNG